MAFSFNGIGTSYYGKCDYAADDSYVTTKWFIVVFIPIIPLESIRVQDASGGGMHVLEQSPLHMPQVLRTWGFGAMVVALLATLASLKANGMVFAVAMSAALLLPFILRTMAKRRAAAERGQA